MVGGVPPLTRYPKAVVAPAATEPLYAAFAAVVRPPDEPCTAFHMFAIVCPEGCDHDTVQPEIAEEPVSVTVTSA